MGDPHHSVVEGFGVDLALVCVYIVPRSGKTKLFSGGKVMVKHRVEVGCLVSCHTTDGRYERVSRCLIIK